MGLRVHGHVRIRDTMPGSLPSGLAAAATSPETARKVMRAHIEAAVAAHFQGRVDAHSARRPTARVGCGERPWVGWRLDYSTSSPFRRQLGEAYIADALTYASRAALKPNVALFVNEVFGSCEADSERVVGFLGLVRCMLWRPAPRSTAWSCRGTPCSGPATSATPAASCRTSQAVACAWR